jgi:hypothetical protein
MWLTNRLMNLTDLSSEQLRRAAAVKDQIQTLSAEFHRILGSGDEGASPVRKRRRMSAAARAKIAAAQRARWAKHHGVKVPKTAARPRRRLSVATRKRMAELAKARWAKAKAAGKRTL